MNITEASFIVYNYGSIQWPYSKEEGDCVAGYRTRNGEHEYIIPGSQVEDNVGIMNVSNVNIEGTWIFQVNKQETSLVSEADSFYLAFGPTLRGYRLNPYILVSTSEEDDIPFSVECPGLRIHKTGTARKGTAYRVDLPTTIATSSFTSNRGIRVSTGKGHKISVVGVSQAGSYVARFSVLHQRYMKREYVFYTATADDSQSHFTHALIVAMQDNTRINVRAPVLLQAGRRLVGANREAEFIVNEYDTVYILSRQDLSGMKITSFSKPIVVFSGHTCTQIPSLYRTCDTIMEQLPSTYDWGRHFVIPPMFDRTNSYLQVVSSAANTQFSLDCVTTTGRQRPHIMRTLPYEGDFVLVKQDEHEICHLSANNSVMAVQYGISKAADTEGRPGGPALVLMPSTKQYAHNTLVPAMQTSIRHLITLIIPAEYHHPGLIHLNDGLKLNMTGKAPMVYYNNYTITHYIYNIQLQAGNYHVFSHQPGALLGVIAYGYSDSSSFAYLASILSSGAQFDIPLVKILKGVNHGICLNTTIRSNFTFWRNDAGKILSQEPIFHANSTSLGGNTFWCEVPAYGSEPAYYYRQRFTPSNAVITIGGPGNGGRACSFTVKVFPMETTANIYSNITMFCTASVDEDIASMKWHHNDLEVGSGPILYIMEAGMDDNGTYICSVTKSSGEESSASGTLVLLRNLPVITVHPTSIHLVLNEMSNPIRLNCRADYNGGSLWWEKQTSDTRYHANENWEILHVQDYNGIIDQNGDLIFINPTYNTAGSYRCVALNESGTAVSATAEVIIQGLQKPTIILNPLNQTIIINTTVTLQCYAVGYGNITYLWMKKNVTLQGTIKNGISKLIFEDNNEDSEGEYTCVALTDDEIAYSSPAFVTVLRPDDGIVDKALAAFVHPLNMSAAEGEDASFHCYGAHGQGNYTYLWLNENNEVVGNASILVLSLLRIDNSGNYTCLVSDQRGMEAEVTAKLTVKTTAELNITLPRIKDVVLHIADRSRNAVFQCDTGISDVTYTWEKENGSMPNRAHGVNSSTLVIPNIAVADAGRYRCIVTSMLSGKNLTTPYSYLNITVDPPTIKYHPDNLTTAYGGNISITCIAGGYGTLTYMWEKIGLGKIQKSSSSRLILTNITESVDGFYRCKVFNQYGGSVASDYARIKVYVSQRVEVQDCNKTRLSSTLLVNNIKAPSFLKSDVLFLQGPIFSTSKQLSKDMKLLADSMVYICHRRGGQRRPNIMLSVGIAVEPQWILSIAPNCGNECKREEYEIIPINLVQTLQSVDNICKRSANKKPIKVVNEAKIHRSPQNTSVLLLQLNRPILKSYTTKEALFTRSQLIKLQAGNAVDLLGLVSSTNTLSTPVKYKFRIRSKLPPPNAQLPAATSMDKCSEDLPSSCTWIPGSPIVYQPPTSSKYAMLGLAARKEECSEAGVYESHINLSKDIEWMDETMT
jgi:hypothetical protein